MFLKCCFFYCLLLQHVKIEISFCIDRPFKICLCSLVLMFAQEFELFHKLGLVCFSVRGQLVNMFSFPKSNQAFLTCECGSDFKM